MKRITALGLVALCACAPSQPQLTPSSVAQNTRIQVDNGASTTIHELRRVRDDRAVAGTVAAPRERTWQVLAPLFGEMGLPVTAMDEAAFSIGSDAELRRRLLGAPLATFLDCGQGGATRAPLANSYEVRMQLSSVLHALPDGTTEVQLLVKGHAKDPVHAGPPLPCTSTGRLEQRILTDVATRVAAR